MMPSDYNDQEGLNGTRLSRPESPAAESAAAEAISQGFRQLIEKHYLYQKVTVDFSSMDAAVTEAIARASEQARTQLSPGRPPSKPAPATPASLAAVRTEMAKRPWRLATRHMGDDPRMAEIHRAARIGSQPLGIAAEEINLGFYLPPIQLRCPGKCKGTTTFIALVSSKDSGFDRPYPREGTAGKEQIFYPIYRCEMCRETLYSMLIRRTGLKLHLCGFTPRREPLVTKVVPEPLIPILHDAEQAVAEGDVYAGFYHLRTMVEHYLKGRLNIPITEQIRGDELVDKHHQTLSPELKSIFPPIKTSWERLSTWLHTRSGEADNFNKQRDAICKHIGLLATIESDE